MTRFLKTDVCDDFGNTIFNEGEEVEIYKSNKSEKFDSGIGVFIISDNGVRDWICASLLTKKIQEFL